MAADPISKILAALRKDGSAAAQSPAPKAKPKYLHTLAWYAQHYGKSVRTVKRWAKEGLPLDDEAQIREYMANPERQAGRKPEEPPAEQAAAPLNIFPPADPEPEELPPVQLTDDFFEGSGILAAIERLKKAERERAGAYFSAIRRNQPAQVLANRFKEWTGLLDVLRKLEKDAPDIRRANGTALDRAETEAAIGQVFQAFRGAGNNLPHRAARKVLGLTDYDEIVEILEKEMEVVFRNLVDVTLDAVAQAEKQTAQAEEDAREEQRKRREEAAAE